MPVFTTAKETCSDSDMKRFACCFLHIKDYHQIVDWDAAAADFDPNVKAASFKTQVGRALKKLQQDDDAGKGKGGGGGGGEAEGEGVKKAKPNAKGGKKRKNAAEEEDGDEGEEKPAPKKAKGGKKGKKPDLKVEAEDDANAEPEVKAETPNGGLDDIFT